MTSGRYVYGVIATRPDRTTDTELTGVDDVPVQLVEESGLMIACSEVDVDLAWESDLDNLELRLRQHQAVIDRLFEAGSIVPVRFGTVFTSEPTMRQWAREAGTELLQTLASVDGLAEWVLTVTWDPDLARAQLDSPSGGAAPASGTAYLRARAAEQQDAERLDERREALAARLHAAASAGAQAAERRIPASGESTVLRGAYVLPRDEVDAFASAVGSALEGEGSVGLHAELSGPWPPVTHEGGAS